MHKTERHKAVRALFEAGRSKKEIGRLLHLDVKTVRRLLGVDPASPPAVRKDKIVLDEELLRRVFKDCQGYAQRTWEVLREAHGQTLSYSTLTQRLREMGLAGETQERSIHVGDVPGQEMQHDTSDYRIVLGDTQQHLIASGLYLRYSKMRYVKFYRRFDRFLMKCFFDEALRHLGYSARICLIDNTSLARWYGTGSNMVPVAEMVAFARNYGFEWQAHEVGHSDRKAGTERNFWTVTTNFLPGRTFRNLEDLNRQAFEWATQRYAKRPQSKTGLIPVEAFEYEKAHLSKLLEIISPPYRQHQRRVDAYGYIAFGANYFWVPKQSRGQTLQEVTVVEYATRIVLYQGNVEVGAFPLPSEGTRNEKFTPGGVELRAQPRHRKKPSHKEEHLLRERGKPVADYLDFILSGESCVFYKHEFIRRLYILSRKIASPLFETALERALTFRVNRIDTIASIASRILTRGSEGPQEQLTLFHEQQFKYTQREAYQMGRFSEENEIPKLDGLPSPLDAGEPGKKEPC